MFHRSVELAPRQRSESEVFVFVKPGLETAVYIDFVPVVSRSVPVDVFARFKSAGTYELTKKVLHQSYTKIELNKLVFSGIAENILYI